MITKYAYLKLAKFGLKSLRNQTMVLSNYQTKIRLTYLRIPGPAVGVWISYSYTERRRISYDSQVMKHINEVVQEWTSSK